MTVYYTKEFVKMLERLPENARNLFFKQENILKTDWRDSRLRLKKLKTKQILFSIRVAHSYRALFYFKTADEIVFYAIGHRKDIYRKVK